MSFSTLHITEDELELIWRQAEQFREETKTYIIAQKQDSGYCVGCHSAVAPALWTPEGDSVCSACGLVLDSHRIVATYADHCRTQPPKYVGYKHIFHFNERIANINCNDPAIPDDIFRLVEGMHKSLFARFRGPRLWYSEVRKILRSVKVPKDLQEKYRGRRYKKLPLTNLEKKFAERWITIRFRLTGYRPPRLEPDDIRGVQLLFIGVLAPFNYIRHTSECKRERKCHKVHGCAYKLPPYCFIIRELLFIWKGRAFMRKYSRYLIHTQSSASLKKIYAIWDQIAAYNNWPRSYHKYQAKFKPLCNRRRY